MNYKMLDNILSDAVNDAELCCDDIPGISLYLDQIIHLISDKSHEGSPRFYGRTLTKTMVNNYSKAGLITPVNGKKYTKEQIVQMLMINSLKNTFSISQIKGAMDTFYSTEDGDSEALMILYDKYVELRRKAKVTCPESVKEMIEVNGFEIENDIDYLCAVLGVVAMADYFHSIATAMLEIMLPEKEHAEGEDEDAVPKEVERQVKRGTKVVKKEIKKATKVQKKTEKIQGDVEKKNSVHTATDIRIEDELSLLEKEVDRALEQSEED